MAARRWVTTMTVFPSKSGQMLLKIGGFGFRGKAMTKGPQQPLELKEPESPSSPGWRQNMLRVCREAYPASGSSRNAPKNLAVLNSNQYLVNDAYPES
jgi:hypothetical protein